MRVGFDASRVFDRERTGTENYSYELLHALGRLDKQNEYLVYTRGVVRTREFGIFKNFQFINISWPLLWTQAGLALRTWKDKLDVLFIPAHTLPVFKRPGLKTVVTLHGLEYEYLPQYYKFPQKHYLTWSTRFAVEKADRIIAVSEFTKNDLLTRWGTQAQKIKVVQEGVNIKRYRKIIYSSKLKQILSKYNISHPYVLFVGVVQPRKNLVRLIEAFSIIKDSCKSKGKGGLNLVIAGKLGWMYAEILKAPQKYGVKDRVKFLGFVKEADLPALFKQALVYIQPSLTEGFGLPVLEAMAAGTPVIASRSGALPEVVGEAGLFTDPLSVLEMANSLRLVIENRNLREELVGRGYKRVKKFTWEKTAKETLGVLREAVKKQDRLG